jgi:hypothetical protein
MLHSMWHRIALFFLRFSIVLRSGLFRQIRYSWGLAILQGTLLVGVFYWIQCPPNLGIAVAGLGLVAIIMSIRAEEKWGKSERTAWLILASVLMIVEVRAIQLDHDKHESEMATSRRREELARKEASDAFTALLNEGKGLFEHQTNLSKEDRDQITGGDSYVVVAPNTAISVEGPNTFVLSAFVGKNGKRNGVPDAHIYVRKLPIPNEGKPSWVLDTLTGKNPDEGPIFVGPIYPDWIQLLPKKINPSLEGTTEYVVNVFARNKPTVETLRVRRSAQKGMWEYFFKVLREVVSGTPNTPGKYKTLEVTEPEWRSQVIIVSK